MAVVDYDACYAALQLKFGASVQDVNAAWRMLSRIHHPDRHARDPKAYQLALEKQKELNNARDSLKKWFESNPHAQPPSSKHRSNQRNTQEQSTDSQSSNNSGNHDKDQSRKSSSQQQTGSRSSGAGPQSSKTDSTSWFEASALKLTPLQQLVEKIDMHCGNENQPFVPIALSFTTVFGPLWIISATFGVIFPELPGHYPDWMMAAMLFVSGWCSWYIFRWFFAETELIKLQQKELYFTSSHTLADTIELAKTVIGKQALPNATCTFSIVGNTHEANIQFDEEVFPDVRRPRSLKFRFAVRPAAASTRLVLEIKAESPFNAFSCKHMAETVVTELKKELDQIAA